MNQTDIQPKLGQSRPESKNKGNAGKGRQAGSVNKYSKTLKDMILGALDAKGGQAYLERQADENPVAFMGLIAKVLPVTLATDKDNPLQIGVIVVPAKDSLATDA